MAGRPVKATGEVWDRLEDLMAAKDVVVTLWEERIAPKLDEETRSEVESEGGWILETLATQLMDAYKREALATTPAYGHLEEDGAA